MRCPGQDPRYWLPRDVTEAPCPHCGRAVEFMKDDVSRRCPGCGTRFGDPEKDLGCIQWCKYAAQCLRLPRGSLRHVSGNGPRKEEEDAS